MRRRIGVAVVTGGSSGVGRAAARLFAVGGYDVGLIARGREGLDDAKLELESLGAACAIVCADVADARQVEDAAIDIEAALGPISVWVNAAAVSVYGPVKDTPADEIRRVTEVTYLGAVHGTLAALRRMLPRGKGVIVQVSSLAAFRSLPLQAAYSAAKHALRGFTEALRTELLHDRTRVRTTIVHLPSINSPFYRAAKTRMAHPPRPIGPVYQPEVAAKAIYAAARHAPRELRFGWIGGPLIAGENAAPGWLDRVLARAGYRLQQRSSGRGPGRRSNLWETADGDLGAHGDFEARAHASSAHLWWRLRRGAVWAGALAGAGLGLALWAADAGPAKS